MKEVTLAYSIITSTPSCIRCCPQIVAALDSCHVINSAEQNKHHSQIIATASIQGTVNTHVQKLITMVTKLMAVCNDFVQQFSAPDRQLSD